MISKQEVIEGNGKIVMLELIDCYEIFLMLTYISQSNERAKNLPVFSLTISP